MSSDPRTLKVWFSLEASAVVPDDNVPSRSRMIEACRAYLNDLDAWIKKPQRILTAEMQSGPEQHVAMPHGERAYDGITVRWGVGHKSAEAP